ncbi:hypothetical protein JB92DRAFT_2991398 [Gautieria morchelliformis]|nr:hypothetical protein JB92DRAFT_2991398 [Gautieria morchelliformis]
MSSSAESPHNSHLLFIGQQCHSAQCYMVDFLPFRCDHCSHAFCADHYKPTTHACEKYDASKHDRIAPLCPLCSTPVAIPPGQDPNVRMEQHIEMVCSVTTGKRSKQGSMPVCAKGRCSKVLFAPIKCNSCNKQFCAAHRFPSSHDCSPSSSSSSSQPPGSAIRAQIATQTSAASAAAMAAFKRNMATAKAKPSASNPVTPAGSTTAAKAEVGTTGKSTNIFVKLKTDRCDISSPPGREIRTPTSPTSHTYTYTANTGVDALPAPSSPHTSLTRIQPLGVHRP